MHCYTYERYPWGTRTVRWRVLRDGQVIPDEQYHNRRRDAVAAIERIRREDDWREKILAEDQARAWLWTENESRQIDELAAQLKINGPCFTFWGERPHRVVAAQQQERDAEDLSRQNYHDAVWVHAERRRLMAARLDAYRRAGLPAADLRPVPPATAPEITLPANLPITP